MELRVYALGLDSAATGRNIKKRRQQLGMSARMLSQHIGRSPAYVSRIESGERRISNKTMRKIEKALTGSPCVPDRRGK